MLYRDTDTDQRSRPGSPFNFYRTAKRQYALAHAQQSQRTPFR